MPNQLSHVGRDVCGQLAVDCPRALFGPGEVGCGSVAGDSQEVAHAGQEASQLIVAAVDLAGEDLADAGLVDATEPGEFRLGSCGSLP